MGDCWPILELADSSEGVALKLISKKTVCNFSKCFLEEFVEVMKEENSNEMRIIDESDLIWLMRVISYSLTLGYDIYYDALQSSVRIYVLWLNIVTTNPLNNLPTPLVQNPRKYVKLILDSLRTIFVRPYSSLTLELISRQSIEIEFILSSLKTIIAQCKVEHRAFIHDAAIKFLLSATDSLLAGQYEVDDIPPTAAPKLVDFLLTEFLDASLDEFIPSPSFWKTLSFLSKRWRHHVCFIKIWSKKLLALSIQVVRDVYEKHENGCGDNARNGTTDSILYTCWSQVLQLLGNPADITTFNPIENCDLCYNPIKALLLNEGSMDIEGNPVSSKPNVEPTHYMDLRIRQCFFLVCATLARLVDIMHGNFQSCDESQDLINLSWGLSEFNQNEANATQKQVSRRASNGSVFAEKDSFENVTLTSKLEKSVSYNRGPKASSLLDFLMDWLIKSGLAHNTSEIVYSDVVSHGGSVNNDAKQERCLNGEIAISVSSSVSMESSSATTLLDWTNIDGISAGQAMSLGALCRILCSKTSTEFIQDFQLAQCYKVLLEVFSKKDRVILCSIIYNARNIFRVGLKGVELLLIPFVESVQIVLVESTKVRLHPSITEVEMRRACLQVISSVICWPTVFGPLPILGSGSYSPNSKTFLEIMPILLKTLIHSLRHEIDSVNLQLNLALCSVICEESCKYDADCGIVPINDEENDVEEQETRVASDKESFNCLSVLRSVISAICDNLCKPQWSSELSINLAALDALNALTNIPTSILFHKNDLSTGFLIVTSICRFIDLQLRKPSRMHSRDLHSSVVFAYSSLAVWLSAAPLLLEAEFCINTIAEVIELGITGGKDVPINERKASSKRVSDAAEYLLHVLFTTLENDEIYSITDEFAISAIYDAKSIDITKFRHFVIKKQTILSLYDTSKFPINGNAPSVIMIVRTPYHDALSISARLIARSFADHVNLDENKNILHSSVSNQLHNGRSKCKTVTIPPEFNEAACKLDTAIPALQPNPEADKIAVELNDIRNKMIKGESLIRASDSRNVWLKEPLASELSKPAAPRALTDVCDAIRVFLYDMGFITKSAFETGDIVILDSSDCDVFYNDLYKMVDDIPAKLLHTVYVFYVRGGQCNAIDILDNAMNIESSCKSFCAMLAELGDEVEVTSGSNSRSSIRTMESSVVDKAEQIFDHYVIDGLSHYLWWSNAHTELTFVMPSQRSSPLQYIDTYYSHKKSDLDHSNFSKSSSEHIKLSEQRSISRSSNTSSQISNVNDAYGGRISMSTTYDDCLSENFGSGLRNSQILKRNADQRIFIVWLEVYEDMYNFPLDEMFTFSRNPSVPEMSVKPDYVAIYLSSVEDGLIRVRIAGSWTKCGRPGPLVDDCVVSATSLVAFLRLTIISILRRKTVEVENYQSFFAQRRLSIQKFTKKYTYCNSYFELLEHLISS